MVSGNAPGHSKAQLLQIPCGIFLVVMPIIVAIRIWARVSVGSWKGLGLDDWTILASMVFAIITMALTLAACEYGLGQHIANLSEENMVMALKLFYLQQIFYKITINLTKASIILLYLRIFVQRWFRITCYMLLAIVLSYLVASVAASIWQCSPIVFAWDRSAPGTCINLVDAWLANTVFSIVTDFIILGLPMYPILQSHIPFGQKMALMVVFSLGLVTTVTSIMRLPTFRASTIVMDITYNIEIPFYTTLDQNLAIICACLPVCRLPLAYLFPRHFSGSTSRSTRKKFTGTIDTNIRATGNRQSYRQSHYEGQSSGTPISYTHPLEKGILDATAGWDLDEETGSCDMEMEQRTQTRSETQITGPAKNTSLRNPGPGIHFVQEFTITYERQLDG